MSCTYCWWCHCWFGGWSQRSLILRRLLIEMGWKRKTVKFRDGIPCVRAKIWVRLELALFCVRLRPLTWLHHVLTPICARDDPRPISSSEYPWENNLHFCFLAKTVRVFFSIASASAHGRKAPGQSNITSCDSREIRYNCTAALQPQSDCQDYEIMIVARARSDAENVTNSKWLEIIYGYREMFCSIICV